MIDQDTTNEDRTILVPLSKLQRMDTEIKRARQPLVEFTGNMEDMWGQAEHNRVELLKYLANAIRIMIEEGLAPRLGEQLELPLDETQGRATLFGLCGMCGKPRWNCRCHFGTVAAQEEAE